MVKEKEIEVVVRLIFSTDVPEAMKTPDRVLAEHLVNKLELNAQWAKIKSREIIERAK